MLVRTAPDGKSIKAKETTLLEADVAYRFGNHSSPEEEVKVTLNYVYKGEKV
jgi:hypothetical protein